MTKCARCMDERLQELKKQLGKKNKEAVLAHFMVDLPSLPESIGFAGTYGRPICLEHYWDLNLGIF